MNTAPLAPSADRYSNHSSQVKHRGKSVQYLAKSNVDFRTRSRREDADLIRKAFDGRTQKEIAEKASRATGVSPRQIINYLQHEHDMPSWLVKAVSHYVHGVDRMARRIEGRL